MAQEQATHFKNLNLSGALLALAASVRGMPVTIDVEGNIGRDYCPELTHWYPLSASELARSAANYNWLLRFGSYFPHLIFQQRVFTYSKQGLPGAKFLWMADKFLGRDRELASFPIDKPQNDEQHRLQKIGFAQSFLTVEYRIDRNRAIAILLQQSIDKGAKAAAPHNKPDSANTVLIECDTGFLHRQTLKLENHRSAISNPYTFHLDGSTFSIIPVEKHLYLYYYPLQRGEIGNYQTRSECRAIAEAFHLSLDGPEWEAFFERATSLSSPESKLIPELRLENIAQHASKIGKEYFRPHRLKWPLPDESLPTGFFRLQQETMERKYDLAKQTGIDPVLFSYYYHRYATQIDWLTEKCYELMESIRDPQQLWQMAEECLLTEGL